MHEHVGAERVRQRGRREFTPIAITDLPQTPLSIYRARLQFRLVQFITIVINFQSNVFIILSGVGVIGCSHNMNPLVYSRRQCSPYSISATLQI